MWYAAASQLTAGVLDLVLFAPPGAVLGLAAMWAAHVFAPVRFSWRRGLVGALVGGLVVSPLVAFLVAFTAAWDHPSFQFVFNLGAWLALVAGICVGMIGEVSRWVIEWRWSRRIAAHRRRRASTRTRAMPDERDGDRPTAPARTPRYSRHMTVPR